MPDAPGRAANVPPPSGLPPFQPSLQYQVDSTYWGTDQLAADRPYLIAPGVRYGTDIQVTVGDIFQPPDTGARVSQLNRFKDGVSRPIGNDDFAFGWSGVDPLNIRAPNDSNQVNVAITIKGNNNVWKVGTAARHALHANFVDFGAQIEALELGVKALIPGGAASIMQRIADALPATIDESSAYRNGFNTGFGLNNSPYVDLRPGMRLRVDFAANQFVAPGSPLNGLVGSGQFYFAIGRDNDQRIVFDNFLSAISAPEASAPLGRASASSVVDVHTAGACRHYRLFYPTQLAAATAPGDGRLSRNVTLIGADTLPALKAATDAYIQGGTSNAPTSGLPIVAIGFRGRAVVAPEIAVYVNRQAGDIRHGGLVYVPVGTTLRQFLDQQAGSWRPSQLTGPFATIALRRFWADDDGVPKYRRVTLNPTRKPALQTDNRAFDLPLASGDMLNIQFAMDR